MAWSRVLFADSAEASCCAGFFAAFMAAFIASLWWARGRDGMDGKQGMVSRVTNNES